MGSVLLSIKKDAGVTDTSYVQVRLYDATGAGGAPGALVAAVQTSIYAQNINTTYANREWRLLTTLSPSTNYWIVISKSVSGGNIYFNSTAGTSEHAYSSDLTSWTLENKRLVYTVKGKNYIGVQGSSANNIGVYGNSTNFIGVQGISTNSIAVYGSSTNYIGVYGNSANYIGVYGISTNYYGVYGNSTNFVGVYGSSTNSIGVYGISTNSLAGRFDGPVVVNETGLTTGYFRVEGDTDQNLLYTNAATDRIGIGTASPTTKFHTLLTDAGTAAVVNVLTVGHDSSGTPATGFGAGMIFELESSTTAAQSVGRLTYEWVVPTHASRTARAKWSVFDTAEREAIRIEASGTAAMIGFFGVNAVVRQTALTTQLTTITHTAPGTPDYAIADVTNVSPYGLTTADEFRTFLGVVANLQTRMSEAETKLQALGLLT
jgi:hypothetical protein